MYDLMAELRDRLPSLEAFVDQLDRRQRAQGYRLVAGFSGGVPVAAAGFRILENLAIGRHLYVDDLVTGRGARGRGHGARLISWLADHARSEHLTAIHLDCGVQRHDAHRFYLGLGMRIGAYHFELPVVARAVRGPMDRGGERETRTT